MASQNLSPRQKMINMMYLVLTAILALNVSAEILRAFDLFRKSLSASAENLDKGSRKTSGDLRAHIQKEMQEGNSRNEPVLAMIGEIEARTNTLTKYLSTVSSKLETFGDKDPETGEIRVKDEKDKNYFYWMGNNELANSGHGEGEARTLRDNLNAYTEWANSFAKKINTRIKDAPFASLTEWKSDPHAGSEAGTALHSWEFETFHDQPLAANLAMVQKFVLDVKQTENRLLEMLREKLSPQYVVDSLYAFAAPVSNIVPAGAFYEARIAVGMASKDIKPEFFGPNVKIDPGGSTATIRIPASAAVIGEGKLSGLQQWKALVKLPDATGVMKEFPVSGEFTVRKPEAVVKSATMKSLYFRCGNEVEVDVPALGDLYNPLYEGSSGGKLIPSASSAKRVTIVPDKKTFKLAISSLTSGQKIKIDELKYDVLQPPKPSLRYYNAGSNAELNPMQDHNRKEKIRVKVIPDSEFADKMKKDSKYTSATLKVYLQHFGGAELVSTIDISKEDLLNGVLVDLYTPKLRAADPKARIFIEIDKIYRINYLGEKIEENFSIYDRTKGITLK